jgi:hypothetical protein
MEQLLLFKLAPQAAIPLTPQPIPDSGIFKGDWSWPYDRYCSICTIDPRTSTRMLQESPFQVNGSYEGHTIKKVSVVHTRNQGWVWLLKLKAA